MSYHLSFAYWMNLIDQGLLSKAGIVTGDLPDRLYRDMYDDGKSPEEVVGEILAEEGFGQEGEMS